MCKSFNNIESISELGIWQFCLIPIFSGPIVRVLNFLSISQIVFLICQSDIFDIPILHKDFEPVIHKDFDPIVHGPMLIVHSIRPAQESHMRPPWSIQDHCRVAEGVPWNGILKEHHGILEDHPGIGRAHPGVQDAYLGAVVWSLWIHSWSSFFANFLCILLQFCPLVYPPPPPQSDSYWNIGILMLPVR
jgi:hypothetical protein